MQENEQNATTEEVEAVEENKETPVIQTVDQTKKEVKKIKQNYMPRTVRRGELDQMFYIDQFLTIKGKKFKVQKIKEKEVVLKLMAD